MLRVDGSRPALELGDKRLGYAEILGRAAALAARIDTAETGPLRVVGVLASKSLVTYLGPLASHLAGLGYVPLNPRFPAARLGDMLRQSGTHTLVAGAEACRALEELLSSAAAPLTVLLPSTADSSAIAARHPRHRILDERQIGACATPEPARPDPGQTAYLLFTSGSTGSPKGVPVTFASLASYLAHVGPLLQLQPEDRASQTFELGFDLSVHDLFITWSAGACLCPLPEAAMLSPARFIRERKLSAWFSVPSVAMIMARMRSLRPGAFDGLRLSLFCGEALPASCAQAWAAAAPASRLLNLYGPTEATIAIASFEWSTEAAGAVRRGVVPIGEVFPTHRHALVSPDGLAQAGMAKGELWLAGPQVARGYLNDPQRTSDRFARLAGDEATWYRTGDLVERDELGRLHFIGRCDDQIKLRGHRIELLEVDSALREACGSELAVAIPYPTREAPQELVGCVCASPYEEGRILEGCARRLPDYMVPRRLLRLEQMPMNVNGKIDRAAAARLVGPPTVAASTAAATIVAPATAAPA